MKTTTSILLALVMLFLGSCRTQLPDVTGETATFTPQSPHTLTPIVKLSETDTATPTPTNTSTLIPTITWAPLPTLSVPERDAKIRELLETNGGCKLPCWWGITPNKTTWAEALHFLSPFVSAMKQGPANRVSQNGKVYTYTEINVYYLTPDEEESVIWFTIRDEVVLSIGVFPPATEYKYQLHQILSLLGMPKQVYIVAGPIYLKPEFSPVTLVLDYSNIGVVVSYQYVPFVTGENLLVCPQPVGARLGLDDPTISSTYQYTIEQNVERLGGNRGSGRKIEEATNMTPEIFYYTFIDPASTTCLETPVNLWP